MGISNSKISFVNETGRYPIHLKIVKSNEFGEAGRDLLYSPDLKEGETQSVESAQIRDKGLRHSGRNCYYKIRVELRGTNFSEFIILDPCSHVLKKIVVYFKYQRNSAGELEFFLEGVDEDYRSRIFGGCIKLTRNKLPTRIQEETRWKNISDSREVEGPNIVETIVTPEHSKMLCQRFIICHGGRWDKFDYVDGDEQLICLSNESVSYYYQITSEINDFPWCDQSTTEYRLFYLSTVVGDGRRVKGALKNDDDILRMIGESSGDPVIYVITRLKQTSQLGNQSRVEEPQLQWSVRLSGPSISLPNDFEEDDDATSVDD